MSEPWRNRIVGHGEEATDQLLAHPGNWRIHPRAQADALRGVLSQVGWVQNVIVNRQTGHVIDGHLRVGEAIAKDEPMVPVVYVDLDPAEEALVLASLDPLSAMAAADKEKLDSLLREVDTGDPALMAMFAELAENSMPSPLSFGADQLNERRADNSRMGSKSDRMELVCIGRWAGKVDADIVSRAVSALDNMGDPDVVAKDLCERIISDG